MADNSKTFGSPDSNPREWGNSQGGSVGKQPGPPKSTDIVEHKLQHADYSSLASGGVKGGSSKGS